MRGDRTPHSLSSWLRIAARLGGTCALESCKSRVEPGLAEAGPPVFCSRRLTNPYILHLRGGATTLPAHQTPSNAMLNEVYNSRIIELAGNIPRLGRLKDPDATATAHSRLCGSTVTIDLKMDGDTVTDFSHDVKACALGQASSSIMARNVVGSKADELRDLREAVRRMLKENGAPPAGKWADIAVLEPVRDYKARHASTLLTFDAVTAAIDQIEAKRKASLAAE
jgi:NifU-like protein involved in Fe-S cluster formation